MNPIQSGPPDPMALDNNPSMNYKKALNQVVPSTENIIPNPVNFRNKKNEYMCLDKSAIHDQLHDTIVLTEEEKARIHRPWAYSVIIRLTRLRVNHAYLKIHLSILWKPTKDLILIDLGNDYFIVKFLKEENMLIALQRGPWFVNGAFVSVRKWHPNFVALEVMENLIAIWIRLSELPMEYYDHSILSRIGSKMGKLVKIDICTSATFRSRYARICIEVPLRFRSKHTSISRD
ncbi:hypothetical protein FXO37_01078 [Capsicum annuum]|uniref:uncharacterized protein LOC107839436 n=1 Tax=Capsicum annuum TaxID=4072 RepID=UPI0007BFA94D|nr:uncharacterized protein LOC107839436 [Capsicum annuum]KAF3684947.1 hypothetical protein FXO37_01078 [Capsicum annuum]